LLGAAILLGVAVAGAPLACGAVHRPILFAVLGVVAALALATAGLAAGSKSDFKPHLALALPILLLLISAAQIVPIPAALRALLDPAGSELLRLARLTGAQPLSLDPPETYLRLAEAAAALAVGLAALVLSSGRRMRFVATGLVAAGGLAALVVGLGHRAVSEDKVYGLVAPSRGLPVGPFINPNHTAEFLELAAFAALAFAFARPSRDGQRIWKIAAAVLAAGALSALSRGSVLALGAGALTWFLLAPRSDDGEPFHRGRFAAMLIGLVVIVGVALGFGAEKLASSLMATGGDNLTKVSVWLDALRLVRAHPAGIGLGAFGRVYPVYQTLPSTNWFQFVENQPLGLLIEAGIPGALLVVAGLALSLRHFKANARRDRVEASLAAGLVTVLAHNLTDFGLETPGVLLPFCAVLGAMFGRQVLVPKTSVPRRSTSTLAALAAAAVLASIALLRSAPARDFERLLQPPLPGEARAIAHQASAAHPTDYAYALAEARLEPTDLASASSRLRMLNRAIILCPLCAGAHAEAARDLWRLGRHQQALLEIKTFLARAPAALWPALGEIAGTGATAAEIQTLANESNRHEVSRFLLARGMIDAAKETLDTGDGRATLDTRLVRVQIALQANDLDAAEQVSREALESAPLDPRAVLIAAEVASRAKDPKRAIELLQGGLRSAPTNVELNRKLLDLLIVTDRYQAIDRALDGLRRALGESGVPMTEANVTAARVFERRGQYRRAVSEYQAALALNPDHPELLLALARAAEQAGSVTIAVDAYNAVLRGAPGQAEASAALARIRKDKKALEVVGASRSHTGAEDK
jgi:tetratricopeptide (TPR) repeat protein